VNLVAGYANSGLAGTLSTAPNPFEGQSAGIYSRLNQLSGWRVWLRCCRRRRVPLPPFPLGGYGSALSNVFMARFRPCR
jgi:hypothetical protein